MEVSLKIDHRYTQEMQARAESKIFRVYVDDQPKRVPVGHKIYFQGLRYRCVYAVRNLWGGLARYGKKLTDTTTREVFMFLKDFIKEKTGEDLYLSPFKQTNSDINRLVKAYLNMSFKEKQIYNYNMLKNLTQAIVRNPILRLDYGHNSEAAIKRKGFDRLMIDTGQTFAAIKGQVLDNKKLTKVTR